MGKQRTLVGDPDNPGGSGGRADTTKKKGRIRRLLAQLADNRRAQAALDEERVKGFRGGFPTVVEAHERVAFLQDRVDFEADNGILIHTPASTRDRMGADFAPVPDMLVFLYFLVVVFNVDWNDPRRTPVLSALALLLALIATAGVAWTLRWLAHHARMTKPDNNRFPWRQSAGQDGLAEARLVLALFLAAVGTLMGYRVYVDARDSGLGVGASLLIAAFFALVVAALNYVIFNVSYSDGSLTTDEIQHLRKVLVPVEARRSEMRRAERALLRELDLLGHPVPGSIGDAEEGEGPSEPPSDQPSDGRADVIDMEAGKRDSAARHWSDLRDPRSDEEGTPRRGPAEDGTPRRGPAADGTPRRGPAADGTPRRGPAADGS